MSSSNKKRPISKQCNSCGAYFLMRDWEKHAGVPNSGDDPSSTPTTAQQQMRRTTSSLSTNRRSADSRSSIGTKSCIPLQFSECQIQMVQPRKWMMLKKHLLKQKPEDCLPIELKGWERHASLLVNPETLEQLEAPVRSVVMLESSNRDVFILWPCKEVPQLCMSILHEGGPAFQRKKVDNDLFSFTIVHRTALARRILLRYITAENEEYPVEYGMTLQNLSHFPIFLRSYFCGGFLCKNLPVKVFYYGKLLFFEITECDEEVPSQSDDMIEKMEELQVEDNHTTLPMIYKSGTNTTFVVSFDDVEECLR